MPSTAGPWTTWQNPTTEQRPGPLFRTNCRGKSAWRPVATCSGSWRSAASNDSESPSGPQRGQRSSWRESRAPAGLAADGPAGSATILFPAELAGKCIAIGISTGGPPALAQLFAAIRPPMPPIVVVQHMPPSFTKPLAWRLDSLSELSIKEAAPGDVLEPNHVLIAPGGKHLQVRRMGNAVKAVIRDGPVVSGHKPSVDVMMNSVVEAFGGGCLGVIMTGMGRDGADGCRAIRAAGGYVLGQDEATSDVYGMNKVAYRGRAMSIASSPWTRPPRSLPTTSDGCVAASRQWSV